MSLAVTKAQLHAPDLPWNCFKHEELGQNVMKFVNDHEPYFRWWAQVWYENFQFLFGNHNIKWSRRYGVAVDYDFLRQPSSGFQLKSKTNISRVVVEALASLIYSNLPEWEVEAMDESSIKGKRFRKLLQKLLDCYMIRLSMDKEFQAAAVSYVLFGQMAFRTDWNHSGGKLLEIPKWRRIKAPAYSTYMAPNPYTMGLLEVPTPLQDQSGMPIMEDRWEAVVDEMGRQIVDKVLSGDAYVRGLTPMQYRRQPGTLAHNSRWWEEFRIMDYDEFVDEYKNVPGATRLFKTIKPIYANQGVYEFAVRHFLRMQFTTPPTVDDVFRKSGNVFKSSMFKYKVLVVEHMDCPHTEKWKEGRRVIVCNGDATHITKPSYNVEGTQDGWHPYSEAQWMAAPPSSIAPGPMNDVTAKNRELNVKDTLMSTAVRRNMGSALLIKGGGGLDPQKFSGEPGMSYEVNNVHDAARWLHDDMPIPPAMPTLRQMDKDDVYESSGAGDALRGQPSTGASSGYQEKQREEREEKRLAPARKNFESAVSNVGQKLVACIKQNSLKLEDNTMGFLKRAAAGEYTSQDVIAFISTPIAFGTDVKVKKSSMAIKSRASQQAMYMELAAGPLAQRLGQDAKVLDRFLKFFDADGLRDGSAAQRDRAERENEAFLDFMRLGPDAEGILMPKVMQGDNDDIHLAEHEEFEARYAEELLSNEWLLLKFLIHKEQHRLQKQEKEGQLLPGTALQTGTMMATARQTAQPTVQTVQQNAMIKAQTKAQQPQQQQPQQPQGQPPQAKPNGGPPGAAPQGQAPAPQAPRMPGGRTDPQAPSGNTPPARRGGLQ